MRESGASERDRESESERARASERVRSRERERERQRQRKRESASERARERDRSALSHISVELMYSLLVSMDQKKEDKVNKCKHLQLNVSTFKHLKL